MHHSLANPFSISESIFLRNVSFAKTAVCTPVRIYLEHDSVELGAWILQHFERRQIPICLYADAYLDELPYTYIFL